MSVCARDCRLLLPPWPDALAHFALPCHAPQEAEPGPAGIIDDAATFILLSMIMPPFQDYQ
jgi:hypothetical protein